MEAQTYTGDINIIQNSSGDYDIEYTNGQPAMTDGLETTVMLAIFTEPDTWQNDLAESENEKFVSTFPEVIQNGTVSDDTLNDGIESLKDALSYLLKINAVDDIIVTGEVLSVNGLGWIIELTRPTGESSKYQINWDKGELTATV